MEANNECIEGSRAVTYEGRVWRSHRLAWVKAYGPIPEGMCVLRECGNPVCVNVAHLFLGLPVDAR